MRFIALGILFWIGWTECSWADTVIYYRESDGLMVGSVSSPKTVQERSEEYGTDIKVLRRDQPYQPPGVGKRYKVEGQSLVQVPDPDVKPTEEPVEIPLADFGGIAGGIAGAASLVIVARKKKQNP